MTEHAWVDELPVSITVCDTEGSITEMNDRACATFAGDGGAALDRSSVLDCHPEPARTLLEQLLKTGKSHCYTIENRGEGS